MKKIKFFVVFTISFVAFQFKLMAQFCVSSDIQKELFDTSKAYVIKSHIKTGAYTQTATLAVTNKLQVLQVHTDASIFKFKFAGFHPHYRQIPQYYIVMGGSLLLTRNSLTGNVSVSSLSTQQNQKWVVRKNSNGTFSILGDDSLNGSYCWALGRSQLHNTPFTLNSAIKTSAKYVVGDIYQQFWITSLQ